MSYKRTTGLLSFLYSQASGSEKEKLGILFKSAVRQAEEYQKVKKLTQTVSFLGSDGEAVRNELSEALSAAVADIDNPAESMKNISRLRAKLEKSLKKTDELLSSPGFFDDEISVIESKNLDLYTRFYRAFDSCVCYYLLSLFGVEAIKKLSFNYNDNFQALTERTNQIYSAQLFASTQYKRLSSWRIVKRSFSAYKAISYEGYKVEYSAASLSDLEAYAEKEGYIRITPYVFAAASPNAEAPLMGIGRIVGTDPLETLSMLDAEIVMALPTTTFDDGFIPTNLLSTIKSALGTDCFCISPDCLTRVLDRQGLCKSVSDSRKAHKCILCGKSLSSGVACKEHFEIKDQQV